jgi:hypothetical protein
MKYYKTINGDYLISVSTGSGGTEITESEYNDLLSIIHNRPTPQSGYNYKLKADTLEWELAELPPIDDTDEDATESDYITALQDLGVEVE